MTISTDVVWTDSTPTQTQADEIQAQAAAMAAQGIFFIIGMFPKTKSQTAKSIRQLRF
jgi:hypothetical protein